MADPPRADFTLRLEDLQRQINDVLAAQRALNQRLEQTETAAFSAAANASASETPLDEALRITERLIQQIILTQEALLQTTDQTLTELCGLQQRLASAAGIAPPEDQHPTPSTTGPLAPGKPEPASPVATSPTPPSTPRRRPSTELEPGAGPSTISSHLLRRIGRGEQSGDQPQNQPEAGESATPELDKVASEERPASEPANQHVGLIVLAPGHSAVIIRAREADGKESWELPKTHLSPGESIEQAARRLLLIELGVNGQLGPVVGRLDTMLTARRSRVTYLLVHGATTAPTSGYARLVAIHEALNRLDAQDERSILAWTTQLDSARRPTD